MAKESPDAKDAAALIATSPWLGSVHPKFAHAVLRAASPVSFARGTLIYERGDPPGGLFGVIDGLVSIGMEDTSSSIVAGHVFKPGDWFGEIPIIANTYRQIDAMALRDCTLLSVPMMKMRDICETGHRGWRWLAILMAINTGVAVRIARDLLISDPRQRIVSVIRRIIGHSPLPFDLILTQTELAEMCALSRGVVSRVLGELEVEDALQLGYRCIIFFDRDMWRGT